MYNIYIRPLEKKDALISYKWRNDSEVWKYTGSKPDKEITWKVEDEWIDKIIKDNSTKRFAIVVDEVYIGNIQLTNITGDSAVYHIFIGDRNYWGKGISKQATFLILNYAKRNLNLSNVILEVKKNNIAAFKSYLKSGFKLIGEKEDWYQMNYNCNEILPITVSVFVMVYNHENFLKQCLDSILFQRTNFNIEIVIGEDCSTDRSREILLEYQLKYPGKFNLILHKENVGPNKNQEIVLNNCIGKYIALCEGDDYWIDPLKLQKQVDFLEANENFDSCYTSFVEYYENEDRFSNNSRPENLVINYQDLGMKLTLDDYYKGWYTQIMTVLFRKNILEKISVENFKYFRDTHLNYYILKESNSFCFKDVMGVYRKQDNGVYSRLNSKQRSYLFYLVYEDLFINTEVQDINILKKARSVFFSLQNDIDLEYLKFYKDIILAESRMLLFFKLNKENKLKLFKNVSFLFKVEIIKFYFQRILK